MTEPRPIVLITGVGRRISIGTEIARQLARDGWGIAFANHSPKRGFVDEFTLELRIVRAPWSAFLPVRQGPAATSVPEGTGSYGVPPVIRTICASIPPASRTISV
jgi:hypothetical protein